MNKLLSIIIPMYNSEKYIEKCLRGIVEKINNEYSEIIVINDGSTDKSEEICKKYPNINIINKENGGVSSARNLGIKIAKGKYLMFVDADDFLCENWWKSISKQIENENKDWLVYSTNYKQEEYEMNEILEACMGYGKLNKLFLNMPFSKLYKKSIIEKNNIRFNENIINGEDSLFNFEYAMNIKTIQICSDNIYVYRKNLISATNTFNNKIILSDILYHNELIRLINKLGENKKILDYYKLSILGGISICIQRIAILDRADLKLLTPILENEEYMNVLKTVELRGMNLNKFNKLIFSLLKKGKINLVLNVYKIKYKIKRIIYSLKKENCIYEKI